MATQALLKFKIPFSETVVFLFTLEKSFIQTIKISEAEPTEYFYLDYTMPLEDVVVNKGEIRGEIEPTINAEEQIKDNVGNTYHSVVF